jgi:hypothetical protein
MKNNQSNVPKITLLKRRVDNKFETNNHHEVSATDNLFVKVGNQESFGSW